MKDLRDLNDLTIYDVNPQGDGRHCAPSGLGDYNRLSSLLNDLLFYGRHCSPPGLGDCNRLSPLLLL